MKADAMKSSSGTKNLMTSKTRKNTASEMVKNGSKTQIFYDDFSNNRENRLPIVAAARAREASSSTARSTRSGCLRTEEEREVSPTSSSTFRVFMARNRKTNKKIERPTSPTMNGETSNGKTFWFNAGK